MRLKKYLPDFVSDIREFQELDKTCSVEIGVLRNKLQQIQDNQFIETATNEGLSRYEQMLNIPYSTDTDMRRFNILNKYNSTIPFSMMWLRNMLNTTIGRGDFLVGLEGYTLTISVVKSKEQLIETLRKELRRKIPANLVLKVSILSPINLATYTGLYIRTGDNINI